MKQLPADEAFSGKSKSASWPARTEGSRLVGACAPVHTPKFTLNPDDTFFAIGSCFARNIEEHLTRSGISVKSREISFPADELQYASRPNDLLVKYTPGSVFHEIHCAFVGPGKPAEEFFVEESAGKFQDLNLPFGYPAVSLQRGVERRAEIVKLFRKIETSGVLVLTLGLIEHWWDQATQSYMNGAPSPRVVKRYPNRFFLKVLSFTENHELVSKTLDIVHSVNPSCRVVLTTSPVPLGRTFTAQDVIVANSYSKSLLRTLCQELAASRPYVDYFPSYEMVTMSPQDASWEDDLRHVRDRKVGEIMLRFFSDYFEGGMAPKQDSAAKFVQAQTLFGEKRYAEASALLEQLESDHPNDESFWSLHCRAALSSGRAEVAYKAAQKLINDFRPRAYYLVARGRAEMMRERFAQAEADLRAALKTPQNALSAWSWLLELSKKTNNSSLKLESARGVLEAAHSLPPEKRAKWMVDSATQALNLSL